MTTMRYDRDADLTLIRGRRVAILGFGSQGHAHALNLADSGVDVTVGLRETSASRDKAQEAGLAVATPEEAARWGDVVMMLAPDTAQPALYRDQVAPHLSAGDTLMFAHGFNVRFGTIEAPRGVDVSMVAPKGPGHRVRETYQEGGGVPALLAVHQDASGQADALALSYASAIGAGRAGILSTTFAEETETDLFGEQAVLCGGASALVKAGFEVLVELMYRGGLSYMRYSISDTAEWGDYESGPRIIDAATKERMRGVLSEITDGTFARRWIAENETGRPTFERRRVADRSHQLEDVGKRLRAMMDFVDPVDPERLT